MKITICHDESGLILKDEQERITALVPSDRPEIARLIAGAPELLAAAKILVEHIDSVEIDHSFTGLGTLRDLIAKAEGADR